MSTREQQRRVYGALRRSELVDGRAYQSGALHLPGMQMHELATELGIRKPRMSTLLSNMHAGGSLSRAGSPPRYTRAFDILPADRAVLAGMADAYGAALGREAVEAHAKCVRASERDPEQASEETSP